MKKFPISRPYIDECEKKLILEPLESGWLVQGKFVAEFERLFSDFIKIKYAVATSSCTTALHLALVSLGIGYGDKVIVPAFTFIATANAVEYTGAEVVFCDIDLRTFNIDVDHLVRILEEDRRKERKIKAVIPVNLFGLCANLPYILSLKEKYNIKIIEDSACGVGAYIGEKHSGTFGDIGCFSFHPRKSITTGEGGMLVTENEVIAQLVRVLRDHGASKTDYQRHLESGGSLLPEYNLRGYNYRMTDLQGALGVCQMRKLSFILEQRRKIASLYYKKLEQVPFLLPPYIPENYIHGFQSFVCLYIGNNDRERFLDSPITLEKIDKLNNERNKLMFNLEKLGISARQGTHAVHSLGYYKSRYGLKDGDFIKSYAADRLTISLPLFVGMTEEDIDYIIQSLKVCAG